MELRIPLTNEKVCKKFKSQFDLVNYAIRLAENMIRTGRDSRVKIDTQNRALQIISEIVNDKDQFDVIPEVEVVEVVETRRHERYDRNERSERHDRSERHYDKHQDREESRPASTGKRTERKKARKILAD